MNLKISEAYSRKTVAVLKEIRLQKGLSQNKLAEMCGLSRAAIQHIEKGIRNPTLIVCHAIAAAMNISLSTVLKQTESNNDFASENPD